MKKMSCRLTSFFIITLFFVSSLVAASIIPADKLVILRSYDYGKDKSVLSEIEELVFINSTDQQAKSIMANELAALLTSDVPYACKQFVCRQLALVATEKEVPILASFLTDPVLSDMARYALVQIDHELVDKALLKKLPKTSGLVQIGIINSLGDRHYEKATKNIGKLLFSQDSEVVNASALACGKIGGKKSAKLLKRAFTEVSPDCREGVSNAYLMCAEQFVRDDKRKEATQIYLFSYENAPSPHLKAAALKGLVEVQHPQAYQFVISSIRDGQPQLQLIAASLITQFPGKEKTRDFIQLLPKASPDIRVILINALAERNDQSILPEIEFYTTDENLYVRVAAIDALAHLGNASQVNSLARIAANTAGREKKAAQQGLYTLKDDDVDQKILSLLEKSDPKVQAELIYCLVERQIPDAIETLFQVVSSSDASVRKAALTAMGELADEKDLSGMIELLLEIPENERGILETAIAKITKKSGAESECASQLINVYSQKENVENKASIIRIFGRLGNNSTLDLMREELTNGEDILKENVITSFSMWPTAEPLQDLFDVAEHSENKTFAILALRGVIDLIGLDKSLSPDQQLEMYKKTMKLAGQASEKRQIFSRLSEIKTIPAMNYAARYLDDPDLGEEASLAVVHIAMDVFSQNPGIIKPVIEKIDRNTGNDWLKGQTLHLFRSIKHHENEMSSQRLAKVKEVALFDGRSFNGWEGNLDYFRIEDGAIVGGWLDRSVPQNEFLCTKKSYHNFELRLKFKLIGPKEKANAGVQIRSTRIPDHNEVIGYQADIGQNYWGCLYDESRRKKVLAPDLISDALVVHQNDWNEYVIRCVDNRIQLWLNGYETVDYEETDESIEQTGVIGLQIHAGSPTEVWYKDITIKELKEDVPFKVHVVNDESRFEAATFVDINNDNKLDIFCGGFWYEAPEWKKHVVRQVPEQDGYYFDFAAIPQDVDNDGWTDIVNGSWHGKDLFWIRNTVQSGKSFEVFNIDKPGNLETLIPVDINGDGQADILPQYREFHGMV